jgi:hypothetical protein
LALDVTPHQSRSRDHRDDPTGRQIHEVIGCGFASLLSPQAASFIAEPRKPSGRNFRKHRNAGHFNPDARGSPLTKNGRYMTPTKRPAPIKQPRCQGAGSNAFANLREMLGMGIFTYFVKSCATPTRENDRSNGLICGNAISQRES